MALDEMTVEHFKSAVGSKFAVEAGDSKLELELVDAQEAPTDPATGDEPERRTPFTLTFRGPLEPALPQQIHSLEHGDLGALEIFLVQVGVDAEGASYEAIFA